MSGQKPYLDSSALAKRYVEERGSDAMDLIFEEAEQGTRPFLFSLWNVGELAVVFHKYRKDGLLKASTMMSAFLSEMKRLGKSRAAEVVPVSGSLIADAVAYTLKHHVCVGDALQVASCKMVSGARFVTADRKLTGVAEREGVETSLVA